MSPETNLLQDLLRRARSRRQLLLSLRGVAISVGVVAVVLLLTGWAAHRFRYNGAALIVLRVGALLTCLAAIYFALVRPLLKRISDARLARLIEEKSFGTEDRLVTAVEYANGNAKNNNDHQTLCRPSTSSPLTFGFAPVPSPAPAPPVTPLMNSWKFNFVKSPSAPSVSTAAKPGCPL